jgi:hypothetical protein
MEQEGIQTWWEGEALSLRLKTKKSQKGKVTLDQIAA